MKELTVPIHEKIYTLCGKRIMLDVITEEAYVSTRSHFVTLETGGGKNLMSQFATSSLEKTDTVIMDFFRGGA